MEEAGDQGDMPDSVFLNMVCCDDRPLTGNTDRNDEITNCFEVPGIEGNAVAVGDRVGNCTSFVKFSDCRNCYLCGTF